jgi:hypothetical protein
MDEGVPFCPECKAPQIRVGTQAATPPLLPGTPDEIQPPAEPVPLANRPQRQPVNWSKAVPAAGSAGVLLAVALHFPLAGFFFWMLVAGVLAVAFYRRGNPDPISAGDGARIGAIGGILGYILFAIATSLRLLLGGGGGQLREQFIRQVQEMAASSTDPQVQQAAKALMTPEALAFVIVIALVLVFFLFVVLCSIGGAAGASLFRDRDAK